MASMLTVLGILASVEMAIESVEIVMDLLESMSTALVIVAREGMGSVLVWLCDFETVCE